MQRLNCIIDTSFKKLQKCKVEIKIERNPDKSINKPFLPIREQLDRHRIISCKPKSFKLVRTIKETSFTASLKATETNWILRAETWLWYHSNFMQNIQDYKFDTATTTKNCQEKIIITSDSVKILPEKNLNWVHNSASSITPSPSASAHLDPRSEE